jgi:putative ABC transport system substrate-binding protein
MVAFDYDPLAHGYIRTLARPGGNITGLFVQQIELAGKRLELVREAFPRAQAAAVLWDKLSSINGRLLRRPRKHLGYG